MNIPEIRFNGGVITSSEINQAYRKLKIFNNKKIKTMSVILKNAEQVLTPTEIENILGGDANGFSQSSVSQNLAKMRSLNIVKNSRKAKNKYYKIDLDGLQEIESLNAKVGLKTLRALRHVLRANMVNMLAALPGMTTTDLFIAFELEQSVCSLHLGILRRAGIVFSKKNGKNREYFVSIENLKTIKDAISERFVPAVEKV